MKAQELAGLVLSSESQSGDGALYRAKDSVVIFAKLSTSGKDCVIYGGTPECNLLWCRFQMGSGAVMENTILGMDLVQPCAKDEKEALFLSKFSFCNRLNVPQEVQSSAVVSEREERLRKFLGGKIEPVTTTDTSVCPIINNSTMVDSTKSSNRLTALRNAIK